MFSARLLHARAAILRPIVLSAIVLAVGCRDTEAPPKRERVRMIGLAQGPTPELMNELADAFRARLPNFEVVARENLGSMDVVRAIDAGEADIGLARADVVYLAFLGQLQGQARPFTHLRGVSVLRTSVFHFLVRKGSGINTLQDLQGHSLGIGPASSGTAQLAPTILEIVGLDRVKTETLPFREAAARMRAGTLDAMFQFSYNPSAAIALAADSGARLVPVDEAAMDRLRAAYSFFRVGMIPAHTYANQAAPVWTLGIDTLLICRSGLDSEVVYTLTRELFETFSSYSLPEPMVPMDAERTPAPPIPLHEGAARYYRERELFR